MKRIIIKTFIFLVLAVSVVNAASGDLDLTFNGTGKIETPMAAEAGVKGVAIQNDGKIVVAGYSFSMLPKGIALVRYNENGTRDTTFGSNGRVYTQIGSGDCEANAIAIQSDGKIVVAGYSFNGSNNDFAVVRYNSNGSLDSTFDTDGIVLTPFASGNDIANSLVIQTDGKIVVAGSAVVADSDFAIARYNQDGSLDNTFDSDGKVTTSVGTGGDFGNSLAIRSDGRYIVAGYSLTSASDFSVVAYNSNGSLDTTFDIDGKIMTAVGNFHDQAYSVAIQVDGKIIVAGGSSDSNFVRDFSAVRYNENGSLDLTFDADGKVITSFGTSDEQAYSIAIQADGKFVLAGFTYVGSSYDFGVVRYNSDGSLDNSFAEEFGLQTFGNGGKVTINIGNDDFGYGVKIDTLGRIVVAGQGNAQFGIARLQNLAPTAANASIKGKVSNKSGRGISNVVITLQSDVSNEIRTARTNSFGYYQFENLEVGRNYILTINSKRYRFLQSNIFINLHEDFTDANFVAE